LRTLMFHDKFGNGGSILNHELIFATAPSASKMVLASKIIILLL
jgi:hypothetical protein